MVKQLLLLLNIFFIGQHRAATFQLAHHRYFSTYVFMEKIHGGGEHVYKSLFQASRFNTVGNRQLLEQLDSLQLHHSFQYPEYPAGTKMPGFTEALLKKQLIASNTLGEFKQRAAGLCTNRDLRELCHLLAVFAPVYDSLIFFPEQRSFLDQVATLNEYCKNRQIEKYFELGASFFGLDWPADLPFEVAVYPLPQSTAFSAEAFVNCAAMAMPSTPAGAAVQMSVLMHEIFHVQFDEQSAAQKKSYMEIVHDQHWPGAQYAWLLLNEALATAAGNGYVYEKLNGRADTTDWYDNRYIREMARLMYPLLREYFETGKQMDRQFVKSYLELYRLNCTQWLREPEHVLAFRNMISEDEQDFYLLLQKYPYCSWFEFEDKFTPGNLDKIIRSPGSKILVVSKNHEKNLKMIAEFFPELRSREIRKKEEFSLAWQQQDHTWVFLVCRHHSSFAGMVDKFPLLLKK